MMLGVYIFFASIPIVFLLIGLLAGRIIESNHLRRLDARERQLQGIGVSNLDPGAAAGAVDIVGYVDGQAVIAADRFKLFLSTFRKFFGGEMKSLQSVMSRARREAIVRMLEDAASRGADQVWNMRIETSTITQSQDRAQTSAMAEVHVYGTAVRTRR